MNKFTSLYHFKSAKSDVFTMSWIYAGISAWFSKQNRFDELEFNESVDTLFVADWLHLPNDPAPDTKKYFGLINEGSPEYWFDLDNWKNTTLLSGHDNHTVWKNNNISIGFDRWDFHMFKVCNDPRVSGEINRATIKNAKFDAVIFQGNSRSHRVKWLRTLAESNHQLKIITDSRQTSLPTEFRVNDMGYEDYFNKVGADKYILHGYPSYYDEADLVVVACMPHKRIFNDSMVNVILETTYYNTQAPFLTEKTYKALINSRPFIIFGDTNSLRKLQDEGFKTFGDFCDESYDQESNLDARINKSIAALLDLVKSCKKYPDEIDAICQHNHRHFFNISRLENKLAKFGGLCLDTLYKS